MVHRGGKVPFTAVARCRSPRWQGAVHHCGKWDSFLVRLRQFSQKDIASCSCNDLAMACHFLILKQANHIYVESKGQAQVNIILVAAIRKKYILGDKVIKGLISSLG